MVRRILVADDEPRIVEMMCRALQRAGFETAGVFGGEEAIRWLATSLPPDLVICDHRMPGTDGPAVRDWMVEQPQLDGVPFMMVTGKFSGGISAWFDGHVNFDYFLTKPFVTKELVYLVQRALGYDVSPPSSPSQPATLEWIG